MDANDGTYNWDASDTRWIRLRRRVVGTSEQRYTDHSEDYTVAQFSFFYRNTTKHYGWFPKSPFTVIQTLNECT